MNRDASLADVEERRRPFDVVVVGGGATGAGIALDAASRKLDVLLLERGDFGTGTSSRSTKIIHGGVRYLAQGRIGLVREALRERAYLLRNAPHLVTPQAFLVPVENAVQKAKYFIGLNLYDALAGRRGIEPCKWLSKRELTNAVETLDPGKFTGAMRYYDAQFDDTRLLINILQTAVSLSACVLNYAEVVGLNKDRDGRLRSITFRDHESGKTHDVTTKSVINATGALSDSVLKFDQASHRKTILPSQGAHIVVSREFLPHNDALLMPRTPDGRIMFAIPWLGHCLIGTTDTPVTDPGQEPIPKREEIDMILTVAGKHLRTTPMRENVLSMFAGIRPLVQAPRASNTSKVSREHRIDVLPSGLISISGGKWTTYRLMAAECVDAAARAHNLPAAESHTQTLKLISTPDIEASPRQFKEYGKHARELEQLVSSGTMLDEPLCAELSYTRAHCVWAIRKEMARTIEDVLARRTRALFLNARSALTAAPVVLELLKKELGLDAERGQRQLQAFEQQVRVFSGQNA